MSHRFNEDGFGADNGAKGRLPVTIREWELVGISSDLKAFHLMNYLYGFVAKNLDFSPFHLRDLVCSHVQFQIFSFINILTITVWRFYDLRRLRTLLRSCCNWLQRIAMMVDIIILAKILQYTL